MQPKHKMKIFLVPKTVLTFLPLKVLQLQFTLFFLHEMSSAFHKHEKSSSLALGVKLHILSAQRPFCCYMWSSSLLSTTPDTCRTKLTAWSTHYFKSNNFSGILFRQSYICTRLNFTARADWQKTNVKLYLWWTNQSHTAKEQTQPAALLCTHYISLSVPRRRLQFPKGSCIPVHNLQMCLPVRHWSPSLSQPSQQ